MSSKSVLEHFTVPDDFQNGNTFKGKCMHCGTLISGSYKVTSNFVTHMKTKHRDLYILHSENKEIQPTLTQCIKKSVKYSPSDPKQLEMTNALIMFIAGDLLPLSIVESEEFKNLMEKADTKYQVPSRKHLSSKLLHEKSVEIKNNLVNTLKRAESVCLTIDLWSSRQMRAKLAVQYLAIPATSAPVERLFSTAGKTFRPERCRLADGTFEKLMMVKCNGKMLK
ncbi:Hypothetical predicted protein [Mytilus galloprovincialis]|uniref:HAT C-terminal dimerisation domain-containing protein n=1 Tax=Mytilus galloprovincialis TaxID=29158 RepID=A0A8B6FQ13_MYTGA|nr:Hypothetical predicted protein [Mytilus galloprovincialis]